MTRQPCPRACDRALYSEGRRQGGGSLLPASLQASAVIIMWVESREWMKLGGKALPCLAASGVVLVPFWMRTFCSTVQIDWSSCTVTARMSSRLCTACIQMRLALVSFQNTFCSTIQINWSSCATQLSCQACLAVDHPQPCLVGPKRKHSCQADGLIIRRASVLCSRETRQRLALCGMSSHAAERGGRTFLR